MFVYACYSADVRSIQDVERVFDLAAEGLTRAETARITGVSYQRVHHWTSIGEEAVRNTGMRRTQIRHVADGCQLVTDAPARAYAYLLGQYLGDGSIVRVGRADRLAVTTCDDYPQIRQRVVQAVNDVMPGRVVRVVAKQGCADVVCYSTHWTWLFPQHAKGKKHLRPIELHPWQRKLALRDQPEAFLRGLIDSDGCRCINVVHTRGKEYRYVRYFFSNRSHDIRSLFAEACAAVGAETRPNGPWSMSVARRRSVEILEQIVGPKG